MAKVIAIVYNTSHYIYMFRLNLIKRLQELGFTIYALAPFDEYTVKLEEQGVKFFSNKD